MNRFPKYEEATKMLSISEKVGQSFMPAAYINDTEEDIRQLEKLIENSGVGGICFFHSRASAATNFEGPREVIYNEASLDVLKKLIKRYQSVSKYPLVISIDAEWGLAMRIENTSQYPYAITLGAMENQEHLIYEVGLQIGRDCREAGIHWNFAPVADINNNPDNPVIGYRSFGEIPWKVGRFAAAFCKGLQSAGIMTSAKHFPGHGDTATDSHLGLPLIDKSREELYANELQPFIKLINKGVDSVMVGHLEVPALGNGKDLPASVSKAIIDDFLRGELKYDGVVVSDALNMHAVSKKFPEEGDLEWHAYRAGTDVLCYAGNVKEGISRILEKENESDIEEHFRRVWKLKEKVFNPDPIELVETQFSYSGLMNKVAEKSLCLAHGNKKARKYFIENGFILASIGGDSDRLFCKLISEKLGVNFLSTSSASITELESFFEANDRILLAIYPPNVKPRDNFGLSDELHKLIEDFAQKKQIILYLFGNPYFLNTITLNNYQAIWVVFQDFPEFENYAADHFFKDHSAAGVLPVSIKSKEL